MGQELGKQVLDLVKRKKFYPSAYVCDFGTFNENLLSRNEFYSSLNGKKISDK